MKNLVAALLIFITVAWPAAADQRLPGGEFRIVNTTGFIEKDGHRTQLPTDTDMGQVNVDHRFDGTVSLSINDTEVLLYPVEAGLAGLSWNADETNVLHGTDFQALNGTPAPESIPVWGADLAWPGLGLARLVFLPQDSAAYAGFLISYPEGKTVVRQMEFRKVFGPRNRPE
ncbi:hypothetical protein [uncultured Roseibium sp.]|uniref:hypothetical protein n=1 Tax=uncultured Roseibium sp. TaxID=1936171 RepID=UPI002619270B|nr:hypothetical protein [uncultured Roseibium sp.]